MNPAFMVIGAFGQMMARQQQGRLQRQQMNMIAEQNEQNAEFEKVAAMQARAKRQRDFYSYRSTLTAVAAFNNRGPDDRSIKAIQKAAQKDRRREESTARLNSMLAVSRHQFAAADARVAGQAATVGALGQNLATMGMTAYRYSQVKG